MPEHLSDGKFAKKELAEPSAPQENSKPKAKGNPNWKKGQSGNPKGRPKGVPNKITRDVKAFIEDLVTDSEVQESVRERIKRGDNVAFFRALEHFIGKPREQVDAKLSGELLIGWKGEE